MLVSRNCVMLAMVTVLSLVVCSVQADGVADTPPTVITKSGPVQGIKETSTLGKTFYSYYGIPFASPPIGNLRLKGIGPINTQKLKSSINPSSAMPSIESYIKGPVHLLGPKTIKSYYYSIKSPANPQNITKERPVMVYIHGGAFFRGSAAEYPPYAMMNEDIILVVIQYRLGALGFMSTEDKVMNGNYGLKDQTLALKWVQENIWNFGGNALRITLFGESAGAASVHFQILSPKSLGMFHQAILQSGSALCSWSLGAAHREVAKYTGSLFNCSSAEDDDELTVSTKLEQCFSNLDAEELVAVVKKFMVWSFLPILMGPRIDGDFIPKAPESLMQESRFKRIQMMAGVTSHDGGLFSLPLYGNEYLRVGLQHNFPNIGPVILDFGDGDISPLNMTIKIFDHFIGGLKIDAETADNITRMLTERHFSHATDLTTMLHARTVSPKKNVFRYQFSYKGQHSIADRWDLEIGKHWVTHADDLFYLFEGGKIWKPLETEDDKKMRSIMTKLWSNFAIYGHPTAGQNDSLGFTWDPVTTEDYQYLDLTLEPSMKPDSRKKERDFWLHLPTKQNFILFPEKMKDLNLVPVEPVPEEGEHQSQTEDKQNEKAEEIIAEPINDNQEVKEEKSTSTTKKDEL
ncbi:unnamed protein product, partial [Meganyctiphanes norvegica]